MANEERSPGQDPIAAKARELWRARGGTGGSPEEDWYRAEQFLRNENVLTPVSNTVRSRGNSPSAAPVLSIECHERIRTGTISFSEGRYTRYGTRQPILTQSAGLRSEWEPE